MNDLTEQKCHTGGGYVEALSGESFKNFNPGMGKAVCRVQQSGPDEGDVAVAGAKAGFSG